MKFRYYLENINGIGIYPLISLLLFVAFFIIVTLWVIRSKNSDIQNYKNMPFNN